MFNSILGFFFSNKNVFVSYANYVSVHDENKFAKTLLLYKIMNYWCL